VTGSEGMINKDTNICRFGKFGYNYINSADRITKPLIKTKTDYKEISFEEAYKVIKDRFSATGEENAVFAGGRLSNEEMYLAHKLAKQAFMTHNLSSFQYLNRGSGYFDISESNTPLEQIAGARHIYIIGSEINYENPVAGYMINDARLKNDAQLTLITTDEENRMINKSDKVLKINSYYHFIKALNRYYLEKNEQNNIYIRDNTEGFEEYKSNILNEDFNELIQSSGIDYEALSEFAEELNNEMNAVIVFSEKYISSNAAAELRNLAMITGKLGKTSSGIIVLKESSNSQGLADNCIYNSNGIYDAVVNGRIKNVFILGEDPIGCALDMQSANNMFDRFDFIVVQDNFLTETAKRADLILPASLPLENTGSYSNTQKVIQRFEAGLKPKVKKLNTEQLTGILNEFDISSETDPDDIFCESIKKMYVNKKENALHKFTTTSGDNYFRIFENGCDSLVKRFEDEFTASFSKSETHEQKEVTI
jgi:predicted molibdopterin-dependent oxidoreductase YjgC